MKPEPLAEILVLYNTPVTTAGGLEESDAGILQEVVAVCNALTEMGYRFRQVGISSLDELRRSLSTSPEPVVLNLVEALQPSVQDASVVPGICYAFGKACTGNDSLALMLGLDKWRAKALFSYAGLCTPWGTVVAVGEKLALKTLPAGPFIVKPLATDASEGIDDKSVVQLADSTLTLAIRRVHEQFSQAALVEQFVGQRELNISILQTANEELVLPIAEIDFSTLGERPPIVGYAAKWLSKSFEYNHTPRLLPAPLDETIAVEVRLAALAAWQALGCQGYARVDMRLAEDGTIYILEVNPNPDISLDAGFTAALLAGGISYNQFIATIIHNAQKRRPTVPRFVGAFQPAGLPKAYTFRPAHADDRSVIRGMLVRSGFFRDDEVLVALEVLDDALSRGEASSYKSYVLEAEGRALGWISWGPTPCTIGTYDIYWMVVDPLSRGGGLGSALLAYAEERIRKVGGRLAVIETSGSAQYYPTRQFYLKRGYREEARIADFYAPGDDRVLYTKIMHG